MSRHVLPRRTLLRGFLAGGAAVALPLPRLAGMLDGNGTALANGSPLRPRYMTYFFGNGIHLPFWVPPATGKGEAWALSPSLAPLAELKPWLTAITGYDNKHSNTFAHASHPVGLLTGAECIKEGIVSRPSIDQKIADLINLDTAFPGGIHVGIGDGEGIGGGAMGAQISFRGTNAPNPPNYSPAALFATLLGLGGNQEPDPMLFRRKSLLDAVSQDIADLKPRLGSADRIRLDRHLTGIDELQTQINASLQGHDCGLPVNPDDAYPDRGNDGSIRLERCTAFADLLAFAFSCELSRVATFMFSCGGCHTPYFELGQVGGFHEEYGHLKNAGGYEVAIAGFHEGVAYAMNGLATLIKKFRDTPDGEGSLLDNSIVFATSCVADPSSHDPYDYPMLLLGKGGGLLPGDLHHRGQAENACKVPFSLLKMFGSPETSYGDEVGFTDAVIPELFP